MPENHSPVFSAMDLILCHTTADFDTLGAAIALSLLQSGSKVVLTGGSHPTVRDFLALHRDEYALIERRSVNPQEIRALFVVDTQWRDRLGKAAEWLDLRVPITVYDHHLEAEGDVLATATYIEAVGATTTVLVEKLQAKQVALTIAEATVMALGIHVDTGSLTFDHTTVRDAAALTWLMAQGASLRAIAEYVEPSPTAEVQDLLSPVLAQLQTETVQGFSLGWVLLAVDRHIPGLSSLAAWVMGLTNTDVLLLAAHYPVNESGEVRLTVIGRCRSSAGATSTEGIHLDQLFKPWGGGGHSRAAALSIRTTEPQTVLADLLTQLKAQIPQPPIARSLMSAPVRTIRPETTIAEAQRILLRYGHSGLAVMDQERLVGVISRRDLDIALHHGFSHAPVKGYMATNLKTIAPDATLPDIEALMVTYDIGRLPVLEQGKLAGIVTRTDVLRQLHQERSGRRSDDQRFSTTLSSTHALRLGKDLLQDRLLPSIQQILTEAAQQAEQRGWQLYLVGGAVRDLLLAQPEQPLLIDDIDLVVDGFHPTAGADARCSADTARVAHSAAGVALAQALQQPYPAARLQIHGQFQTAAILWHNDPVLDSLWIDIATARTEFYPYPAANPEVEASSIRQDLYRRDFTINALAVRLTAPNQGEILDFFGGLLDLEAKLIRVLHANSFIEDPTRIYRAVRFAVRLGFAIEPQTEGYIRYAIASGVYQRPQTEKTPALQTRLKQELKYILQAPYWKAAVQKLLSLGALCCIHADLKLTDRLWWQLRMGDRWLKQFDPTATLPHWQVLLEILLSALDPEQRWQTADRLQLSAEGIERLRRLHEMEETLSLRDSQGTATTLSLSPSQTAHLFSPYDLPTLILLASTQPRPIRRQIWKYLTHWRHLKSPLNGNDLKALGYSPGRQFKQILDALLTAALEGQIATRSEAEAFLKQHFPL